MASDTVAVRWNSINSYTLPLPFLSVAVLCWGQGAQAPKSCPGPKFLIGSIVISLSRCCLPNGESQAPKYFFLESPPSVWGTPCRKRRHQHHHQVDFLSTSENLAFQTILSRYHIIWSGISLAQAYTLSG